MANKNSTRTLPMKAIESANKQFKEIVTVDFHEEDGKVYTVSVHPFFDPLLINELIEDLGEDLNQIQEAKIEFPDKLLPSYVLYKCLDTFTDFPISKSKSIKQRISYFTEVIKTHYFKEVTDTFLQEEFNKVWNKIMEVMAAHEKIKELGMRAQAEIQNLDLQSPEMREKIQGVPMQ